MKRQALCVIENITSVLNDDTLEDVRLSLLFCFIILILQNETSVAF
jgi:hypothetical protein